MLCMWRTRMTDASIVGPQSEALPTWAALQSMVTKSGAVTATLHSIFLLSGDFSYSAPPTAVWKAQKEEPYGKATETNSTEEKKRKRKNWEEKRYKVDWKSKEIWNEEYRVVREKEIMRLMLLE